MVMMVFKDDGPMNFPSPPFSLKNVALVLHSTKAVQFSRHFPDKTLEGKKKTLTSEGCLITPGERFLMLSEVFQIVFWTDSRCEETNSPWSRDQGPAEFSYSSAEEL